MIPALDPSVPTISASIPDGMVTLPTLVEKVSRSSPCEPDREAAGIPRVYEFTPGMEGTVRTAVPKPVKMSFARVVPRSIVALTVFVLTLTGRVVLDMLGPETVALYVGVAGVLLLLPPPAPPLYVHLA